MRRKALKMEQEEIANEYFIYRLGNLPVVSSAWTNACDLYAKTKDRNAVLRATCNLAEGGVQTAVSATKPLVDKCQPQIEKVNAYACEKLALLEEQYPVITKPTDEVLKESKEKCADVLKPVTDKVNAVVVKPVTDKVNAVRDTYNGIVNKGHETIEATKGKVEAVKEYGMSTVNKSLETPLGKFAMEKMNEALTVSEEYVEKYLPPSEEELEDEKKAPVEVDEVSTFTRVTSLSTKLRQRMYKRAMRDLKGLQMRSKEKLEGLNFTVDLIQYAKNGAGEVKDVLEEKYDTVHHKMTEYWEQINREEDGDEEEAPTNLEGKTIAVARHLTRQVKQGMTTVSGYLPTRMQPAVVRERMENALRYTEELYQSFKEAKGFDDLPSWLLLQAKEKMSYVQETISFLTDTFLVGPINWMVPRRSIEPNPEIPDPVPDQNPEIEMESVNGEKEEE